MGIIALGLGLGLIGLRVGSTSLAVLGFAGGLLHVFNHALFKGLLFLGAGSVLHATGTRDLEELGGLLKRMPWTGLTFLTGAMAISGLPPPNGFVSEFLLYLGAFGAVASLASGDAVPALVVIAGLALIGGLALACFTKAFGVVFLGEPRGRHTAHAHEAGPLMRIPMQTLAAGCLLIGMLAPLVVRALAPLLEQVTRLPSDRVRLELTHAAGPPRYRRVSARGPLPFRPTLPTSIASGSTDPSSAGSAGRCPRSGGSSTGGCSCTCSTSASRCSCCWSGNWESHERRIRTAAAARSWPRAAAARCDQSDEGRRCGTGRPAAAPALPRPPEAHGEGCRVQPDDQLGVPGRTRDRIGGRRRGGRPRAPRRPSPRGLPGGPPSVRVPPPSP